MLLKVLRASGGSRLSLLSTMYMEQLTPSSWAMSHPKDLKGLQLAVMTATSTGETDKTNMCPVKKNKVSDNLQTGEGIG